MPPKFYDRDQIKNEKTVINYQHFINEKKQKWGVSPLRELADLATKSENKLITLANGSPNPEGFPITDITVSLRDGTRFSVNNEMLPMLVKYSSPSGFQCLQNALQEWQDSLHGKQSWDKREIVITCGSQEGLKLTSECFMSNGDPIVFQNPAYPGAIQVFKVAEAEFIPADQDGDGIIPELLDETLKRRLDEGKPMPKLFYVNPTGSNPTGVTMTIERRHKLYKLACDYNLLILEDDPYYFMEFTQEVKPSFLKLDTDGRVLRFDSFSKIFSAGMRMGYITGPSQLLQIIKQTMEISSIQCSSFSQMFAYKVFENWGHQKLLANIEKTKNFYLLRRNYAIQEAEKYLKDVAEWIPPSGGMFLWIRIKGLTSTKSLLNRCQKKLILFSPGYFFELNKERPNSYVRLAYSEESPENISKVIQLLAEGIKEELAENQP